MAFAPTPSPLQRAPFPSLLPVWLEPGVMELAGWNQLLANEDFPTGLGLGKEGSSCCLDSWPECPLGKEPAEGEGGPRSGIHRWQPIHYWRGLAEGPLLHLLILSPRFVPAPAPGLSQRLFVQVKAQTDRLQIQFVCGSQFRRKKENEGGVALL